MRPLLRLLPILFAATAMISVVCPALAQKEVSSVVTIGAADTAFCCQAGDHLRISGSFQMDRDYDNCLFYVDNVLASQRAPTLGTDTYSIPWIATAPGAHLVQIFYTMQPRGRALGRRLWITVSPSPPAALRGLPDQVVADVPLTVVETDARAYPLARVDFFFRDRPVGSATSAPFTATLPVEAVTDPGVYPIRFVAYDKAGRPYHSHTFLVEVPQRVQPSVTAAVTIQKGNDRPVVSATLLPGVKAAKANFWIARSGSDDWQTLAEATSPPFTTSADFSRFPTAAYRLKVTVTSIAGAVYESQPTDFAFTNGPEDNRIAKEAKEKADIDALLAREKADADAKQAAIDHVANEKASNLHNFFPHPGFDPKIFRGQLAELAFYEPEKRRGMVGTVHGLSVLVVDGTPVTGAPTTVTALVRPGSGQVNFLAYSEEDARIAAQQAAEYCKMATGSYFRWDWAKYDMTVGYLENQVKNAGPSAGLADAVAIMSAAVNLPVDDSVAMTGAITLRGDVMAVGGVNYKAESAFRDTHVHTLIIPADSVPLADLIALYDSEPALCFNRRVVLVRTVDDALREAIVGWRRGDYLKAEMLVQGGLRHFARGEDSLALAALHAAQDLDPNNWTISHWISMVQLTGQQERNDAPLKAPAVAVKVLGPSPLPAKETSVRSIGTSAAKNLIDPEDVSRFWNEIDNGGHVTAEADTIRLRSNGYGYPVLKTLSDPFPTSGDWKVSFAYRYTTIGNYGVDLVCRSDQSDTVTGMHQDVHGQLVLLNGKTVFTAPPNTDWHVASFAKAKDRLTARFDGKEVGSENAGVAPSRVQIGGGNFSNPWDWNDLQIRSIRVDVTKSLTRPWPSSSVAKLSSSRHGGNHRTGRSDTSGHTPHR